MTRLSVGLPRMHKEAGEQRDFTPPFVAFLGRVGVRRLVLEEGYGSGMGFTLDDYRAAYPALEVGTYGDCLSQQLVCVLRCPAEDVLRALAPGTVLFSMLHFPTRPGRVALLRERGIRAVSLDGLTDDTGRRLVQNLESVGWNGVEAAFRELARLHPRFEDPRRAPLQVTILGSGAVGGHAAYAAGRYGDEALRRRLAAAGVPGVAVMLLDYDVTGHEPFMRERLAQTDLLVDATYRPDPSRPVIPNAWVAQLPAHAVLLDLSVDPYDLSATPPTLKGIEGMPEGNLDRYVFAPDDPVYARMDPRIRSVHRRTALSCYSWPGVHPRQCMETYGAQLQPLIRVALEMPLEALDPVQGRYFERAVARAEVSRWKPAPKH